MTSSPQILPAPRTVAVFLPQHGQLLGTLGFVEVLDSANRVLEHLGKPPAYAVELVGVSETTASAVGPRLLTRPAAELPHAHTVVVGGSWPLVHEPDHPTLLEQVQRLAGTATRTVSLCVGAFALGALGLLDDRRCTTHWLVLDALQGRFPAAKVQPDCLYTEDAGLFTSAGASAALDLALHLVRADLGQRLALTVARTLVLFAHRPGGQSQFGSTVRVPPSADDRLADLVAHIRATPAADHRVDVLARRVGMSPRHFARTFKAHLGTSPAALVANARIEAAQRLLAQSDLSVQAVAAEVGFGSEETFRRTFFRVAGVSPSAWRERFAG